MSDRLDAVVPAHVRVVRFFEARLWVGDTLFKVLPLLFLILTFWWWSYPPYSLRVTGLFGAEVNTVVMTVFELMAVLPLAIVRMRPGLAAGIIAAGALSQMVAFYGPGVSAVAVPLAVYACAKYGSRPVSRIFFALAGLGALLVGLYAVLTLGFGINVATPMDPDWSVVLFTAVMSTGFCAAVVLASWLLGDLAGRRRAEREAIAEKNRLLERERHQEARLSADAERMRLAREMHDVISHSMSVMIAQADGGRYVLGAQPERAAGAFDTIGATGREALSELRRMLGVLREEDGMKTRPAPGVGDLDQLVADVRASGLPVQLHVADDLIPELREGVALAIYRIVQEALTNTLKHGGAEATATVWLGVDIDREQLVVDVHDTGTGAASTPKGSGSGLLGMSERAALYGGTLLIQPKDPGSGGQGFLVQARFPLQESRIPEREQV